MRMCRLPLSRWCLSGIGLSALSVLVALTLAVIASAAPDPQPQLIAPPPGPLFHSIQGEDLARLAWGVSFAPRSGPWCCLSAIVAGAHPDANVWSLRGPLSTRFGRIQVGAGTLFLDGFGPPAAARLVELATLQAGDDRQCWNLLNTDQVRPFPAVYLQPGWIRDRRGIYIGQLEVEAFTEIVVLAHFTSTDAFRRAARPDLTYRHLFHEPERHRGQVVHLSGRLRRLDRFDPPDEARARGVSDLYEAWIIDDEAGEHPFCAVFTDLPRGLKVHNEQKYNLPASIDGYFYKRYRYKAGDTKKANQFRDAPLVIGHSLTLSSGPAAAATEGGEEPETWGHDLIWVFLALAGGAVAVVAGLTCWFRYSDRRVRSRLDAARHRGFVAPPTESASSWPSN